MLRSLLVLVGCLVGLYYAVKGPFNALLFYLWIAHFRPLSWAWATWWHAIPLSVISASLVIGLTLLKHRRYPLSAQLGLMALFCLWAAISTMNSLAYDVSIESYVNFLKVVLIAYLLAILPDDLRKFRLALLVICVSLGAEPAKQGLLGLILYPGGQNVNKVPNLGDNNGVGLAMTMLFCLILGLFKTSTWKWERVFLALLGLGVLYRAISTYSRGAFLTLAVLAVMLWVQEKFKIRNAVLVGLAVLMIGVFMPARFTERMSTITQVLTDQGVQEGSARSRLHLWHTALIMANDRPLTGVGFDAYTDMYQRYDPSGGVFGERKAAHGTLPGVLADTGYPGAILYASIMVGALLSMVRARRWAPLLEGGHQIHEFSRALQNAVISFMVGGAFLSYMYYEFVWHVFGLCAALALITRNMVMEQLGPARQETLVETETAQVAHG